MNQKEFIDQYAKDNPKASTSEVIKAWMSYLGSKGGTASRKEDPKSITAFCKSQSISRQSYYQNLNKWAPLYANWLKEGK